MVSTRSMAKADSEYVHVSLSPKRRNRQRTMRSKELRAKELKKRRIGLYDDFESTHFGVDHVNGVKKCRETLDDTCRRLNDMASEVESFKELTDVPDTVKGDIESFCGKTRLLVTSKMQKQYQKMINDALDPEYDPPTKVSDLVGFWEMIAIQIEQADNEYDKILRLKNNNWVVKEDTKDSGEMSVPKRSKNVLKPVNKPIKSKINTEHDKARKERLKAIKEAMKAKKLADENAVKETNENFLIL